MLMTGDPWPVVRIGHRRVAFTMATVHEYGPALRRRIVPLISGVGPIEAAIAVGVALERLRARDALPDLVVSLGSAGSHRCRLGDVYQVASVSWRDMDASLLGFAPGVTPFLDQPSVIALATPFAGVPVATLSTGADVVGGDRYDTIAADMVDMETFAVLRACQSFDVEMIGLRGVSDGPAPLEGLLDWTALLGVLDERLATAIDRLSF
jgi:adenosylhomocysteine nucleosidase